MAIGIGVIGVDLYTSPLLAQPYGSMASVAPIHRGSEDLPNCVFSASWKRTMNRALRTFAKIWL